ncbi:MAG: ATP-binding protein [Clostridia bacterium]|nr:ATP-binding protein [Clostridia bacterium]
MIFALLCRNTAFGAVSFNEQQKGVLDLSSHDFAKGGNIALDCEWEFYWDQLLTPEDFNSKDNNQPKLTGWVKVPGPWNGQIDGKHPGADGAATYRLKIKVKPGNRDFGIKTNNIRMANRIYINGSFAIGSGNAARSKDEGYISRNMPSMAFFKAPEGDIDLIVQVANFDYYNSGIIQNIYLGTQENILKLKLWLFFLDMIVITSLLITAMYCMGIYWAARKERGLLYFGLLSVLLAYITATGNEKIFMEFFPFIPFTAVIKSKVIAVALGVFFLFLFIREYAKRFIPFWLLKILYGIVGINIMLVLTLSLRIYSKYDNMLQMFYLLLNIFIGLLLSVALIKKQFEEIEGKGIKFLLTGIIILAFNHITTLLYLNSVVDDTRLNSLSMVVFLFNFAIMISSLYSTAYSDIEESSRKLMSLDKLKDEFLANTSHELRTPLNGIINITNAVLEGARSSLAETDKNNLTVVVAAARRLHNLINDILDMSSLKNGELLLMLKDVDLRSTAEAVIYVLNHLKGDKAVEIVNSIPIDLPPVKADVYRLRQILYNLLENALKFTREGKIEVAAQAKEKFVKIWVEDSGIGIPQDKLQDIFNAFYQVDGDETREAGGTGLGLSITRKLVQLHGGEIAAASVHGQGSRFTFTLPLSSAQKDTVYFESITRAREESAAAQLTEAAPESRAERKYSILAADDDHASLTAVFGILDQEGYYVKTVDRGDKVLAELELQPKYNLVVLDVMMPGMSGYEVLKSIRKRFGTMDLPVLLLTARARPEDLKTAFDTGANDYISKPFDALELKARVKTLIQLKEKVNELVVAQISFLQAQIKPHFLFNSLSVIASLSTREPMQAKELLYSLSDYLRGSFNFENFNGITSLEAELNTVKAYLAIETARFKSKLKVVYDIDEALTASVPLLTIQPLVENAVRHGILKKQDEGTVTIKIYKENQCVVITVMDDGAGIPKERMEKLLESMYSDFDSKQGVGLKNINSRLMLLYGSGLELQSLEGEGTIATIRIPQK